MKTSKIYVVGPNGVTLGLASGKKALAVYPAGKGEKNSWLVLDNGAVTQLKGARIDGVGVARYLTNLGYLLAEAGNPMAERLADEMDVREGTKLVEQALSKQAAELSRSFVGTECLFVPFEPEKEPEKIVVECRNSVMLCLDLTSGFSSAMVPVVYTPGVYTPGKLCTMDANLAKGWLIGPGSNPDDYPRSTEYGGLVEQSVFIICSAGLGTFVGNKNLVVDDNGPLDHPFPKGQQVLSLKNGDVLTVGIDAGDELVVVYSRNGAPLYSRTGFVCGRNGPRLGDVIGSIAAVIVRVQEMDAVKPLKAVRTRKAA